MHFFDSDFKDFAKSQKAKGASVSIPKFQGDEDVQFFQAPIQIEQGSAKVIEGNGNLEIKEVKSKCNQSAFSYFLDGIERKKVFIFNNIKAQIPVTYGYVAAAILKRTDKKMHSCDMTLENAAIYLPYKEAGDEPDFYFEREEVNCFKDLKCVNVGIIDEKGKRQSYPLYATDIEQMAHSAIQTQRGNFEKELVVKWLNNNAQEGWLFVDGRLDSVSRYLSSESKVVGVIKSHRRHYFDYQDQFKVLNMKKGSRSSVFQPDEENIYSWYLRLHENKVSGSFDFGIIRVEVPAKKEFIEKVDEISNWILLERKPVAFPASRWDRMIYPIKYCEDYLKSQAPSYAKLESLI